MLYVPLFAIKSRSYLGILRYEATPTDKKQRRLLGRVALLPQIQLQDFQCRAVIDWVTVGLSLSRNTQHQWLQQKVEAVFGRRSYIKALDKGPGDASDAFEITIQEPDLCRLQRLCAALERKFGFQRPPIITAIEISVDFIPKVGGAHDRAKLFMVLTRHFHPKRDVLSAPLDRPRFSIKRKTKPIFVLGSKDGRRKLDDDQLVSLESDRTPFVDSTYYVGADDADVQWSVMDKIIDTQNPAEGTYVTLDEHEKRVRIEVTLDRTAVAQLGVEGLTDLSALQFSRLQSKFFSFVLPTFIDSPRMPPGFRTASQAWRERYRMMKFINAGVIGLAAMEDAMERQMKKLRLQVRGDLRRKGLTVKPIPRVGSGSAGTFVAYAELNERVAVALRHLEERVAASFSRS